IAFTSRGCSLQKSAIWSNVKAVFSTSQTAVAFGIRGWAAMINSPCAPPAREAKPIAIEDDEDSEYIGVSPRLAQPPMRRTCWSMNKFRETFPLEPRASRPPPYPAPQAGKIAGGTPAVQGRAVQVARCLLC